MKRTILWLLGLMLLGTACGQTGAAANAPDAVRRIPILAEDLLIAGEAAGAPSATNPTSAPTAVPAASGTVDAPDRPADSAPARPMLYVIHRTEWDTPEAEPFWCDLDGDGSPEAIAYRCDEAANTTAIAAGARSIVLDEGSQLEKLVLIDLDPSTPHRNLLAVIDQGSDDEITIELHPEGEGLKKGVSVYGDCFWENDALYFWERTDLLGTAFGMRSYHGEALEPDTDWLDLSRIPSEEELKSGREGLIESGVLLHAVRDVPCEIDGAPAAIPAGEYVWRIRYRAAQDRVEVCLRDGRIACIHTTFSDYAYRIDGEAAETYFDNLFYAD